MNNSFAFINENNELQTLNTIKIENDKIVINNNLNVTNDITYGGSLKSNSDDRIKYNKKTIQNALKTINKLNPVSYEKKLNLTKFDNYDLYKETGLIAQDVYNNVPELRHIVKFDKTLPRNFINNDLNNNCVRDIYTKYINSNNILIEEPNLCSIDYNNLHAYYIKAIQELLLRIENLEKLINL